MCYSIRHPSIIQLSSFSKNQISVSRIENKAAYIYNQYKVIVIKVYTGSGCVIPFVTLLSFNFHLSQKIKLVCPE